MSSKNARAREPGSSGAADAVSTRALPFRLLKLTNLVSRPFFGQLAKKYELSLNEWRTIFVLANHPGISAVELSGHTGLQQMNISRALASLRKSGRVAEVPDPRDLRRTLVSLTRDGVEIYQAIANTAKEHTRELFAEIPADQLEVFSAVVDALIAKAESLLERRRTVDVPGSGGSFSSRQGA